MAYVSVDSDETTLNEGHEGLQFKSYIGSNTNGNAASVRSPRVDRGYIQDAGGRTGFWQIEHYQSYFDVDTRTVLKRCYTTLLPWTSDYSSLHLTPAPDLYGPFWTLTTVICTLFLSSSLAASVTAYLSGPTAEYDFDVTLLSIGVSLVYAYGLGLPILLWLALRYMGVGEWSIVEAVSIWGYGQFVWIPVSILCVIPVAIARWIFVGVAFGLSGYFIISNVYPVLATAEHKSMRLLIVVVAALHAALALTFKILFFSYYIKGEVIGPGAGAPLGDVPKLPGNATAIAAMLW